MEVQLGITTIVDRFFLNAYNYLSIKNTARPSEIKKKRHGSDLLMKNMISIRGRADYLFCIVIVIMKIITDSSKLSLTRTV